MIPKKKQTILFLCTANSCRSQMAEGLMRQDFGNEFDVFSAGTKQTFVHPKAIYMMSEIGIDISQHTSKTIESFKDDQFDYIVTVCDSAKETCPFFPNAKYFLHWSFEDPASCEGSDEEVMDFFRRVRDQIQNRLKEEFL